MSAKIIVTRRWLACVMAAVALTACAADASIDLPKLTVDPARITVAGFSSGAYMATQTQMAWPKIFSGAGLIAGGPYGCAEGKLANALGACMQEAPAIDVDALVLRATKRADSGALGPISALAKANVYVLHGSGDQQVAASVSHAAATFYDKLRDSNPVLKDMRVTWDGDREFAHTLPVAARGDNCDKSEAPYLGHCGFDAAAAVFSHLYGKPPHAASAATGEVRSFEQQRFRADGKDAYLGDTGYVYLPKACLSGKPCGVMVVFHGCKQNVAAIGEAFVREAGFNRWGDAYQVAVLYPQTRASFVPLNPQACWDWWGYSGADYDTRQGVQQQWLMRALAALGVKSPL